VTTETKQRLTIEEYLALERASEERHDYLDGEMLLMRGGNLHHSRISRNVFTSLHSQLGDGDREVFVNTMRVRTPTDLFTYPDIIVTSRNARYDDDEFDTLLEPLVIIEILSPRTEAYDRTTKLPHYRTIPSLTEIALITQDRVHIERWDRQAEGQWLVEDIEDIGRTLDLPSIDCKLPLARIYRRVVFAED
jgi:Uma2 family endonuclease